MQKHKGQVKSSKDKTSQNNVLYRDLTLSAVTQRAMPEAQSTWTKRVGPEPKKHTNAVMNYQNQKDGNVHMTGTPPSVGNQGLITQD